MSKALQIGLAIALIALVVSLPSLISLTAKRNLIKEINKNEETVRLEESRRIDSAMEAIGDRSDCVTLGIVYGTNRCEERQPISAESFPEAPTAEASDIEGAGSIDAGAGQGSVQMGGFLQYQTEEQDLFEEGMSLIGDSSCANISIWKLIIPTPCAVSCDAEIDTVEVICYDH